MIDYVSLFMTAILTQEPKRTKELDRICDAIITNQMIYKKVEKETQVPWYCVAVIHYRESNQSFKLHLHNGDPLTARTVHVPKGRPFKGKAPFKWSDSAIDALHGVWKPEIWNMKTTLEFLERYNGLGYQRFHIYSPYLWDYTNYYTRGLFTFDGSFNSVEKESRAGCVAIIKTLQEKGALAEFPGVPENYNVIKKLDKEETTK